MAWRGLPILAALLMLGGTVGFLACDDTGPSPIGDHAPDDVDSGSTEMPAEDAGDEAATGDDDDGGDDAGNDGGEDEDAGKDAGKDSGIKDAGKDG